MVKYIDLESTWCSLIEQYVLFLIYSIRSVMQKYLEERDELTFEKIFNQKIGEW